VRRLHGDPDLLGGALPALALCTLAGALLGLCGALTLRRRNLGWAWAPTAILLAAAPTAIVVALDRALAAPVGLGFVAASVTATGWGLDAHLEDLRIGGDRETSARARRRLLDPVRRLLAERPSARSRLLENSIPVGRTSAGELVEIGRGDARSGRHVLVPGATGAGKTTTLGALLVEHVVRAGHGAVVLEAKNDAALLGAARSAAASRGAAFRLFSPRGPAIYDPLAHGSVDERSERLVAVEDWGSADADFYRQAASPFLRAVIRVLDAGEAPTTLAAIAAACSPDGLVNAAAVAGDPDLLADARELVTTIQPDQVRAVAGLHARLANLASSDLACRWLDPSAPGERFDLRTSIAAREVVYLRLDTDRTGNVGRSLAQMALLDLGAAASALMDRGVGTFVGVDEFGALEASALERLFARGRAAGFSVALGTQTLADLSAAGPAVRERIGATVSALICHRIGEQEDAEWIAQLIGAVPAWQTTIRTEGHFRHTKEGTRTRGYRFDVNPAELQRLLPGQAYVARLDSDEARRARSVRVVPPWRRLPETPSRSSFRTPIKPDRQIRPSGPA
jgi:Type IV secretion-system coupling protein DNA-binding domain